MTEYDPRAALQAFVEARKAAPPVQSYDELLDIYRGKNDLAPLLTSFITVSSTGGHASRFSGRTPNYHVLATVANPNEVVQAVDIELSRRRGIFAWQHARMNLLLFPRYPTFDCVITKSPLEYYRPHQSSPEHIKSLEDMGDASYHSTDQRGITTVTPVHVVAEDSRAEAPQVFNHFLNAAVTIVDQLTQAE
jgi:hypothetical protein